MKLHHWVYIVVFGVGLLYVYHTMVANKGTVKGALSGLGINR